MDYRRPHVLSIVGFDKNIRETEVNRIAETYGCGRINVENLALEAVKPRDSIPYQYYCDYKPIIEHYQATGKQLPAEIQCALLLIAIRTSRIPSFVLDNFPSDPWQVYTFADFVEPHIIFHALIYLEVSRNYIMDLIERYDQEKRMSTSSSGSESSLSTEYLAQILDHKQQLQLTESQRCILTKNPEEIFREFQTFLELSGMTIEQTCQFTQTDGNPELQIDSRSIQTDSNTEQIHQKQGSITLLIKLVTVRSSSTSAPLVDLTKSPQRTVIVPNLEQLHSVTQEIQLQPFFRKLTELQSPIGDKKKLETGQMGDSLEKHSGVSEANSSPEKINIPSPLKAQKPSHDNIPEALTEAGDKIILPGPVNLTAATYSVEEPQISTSQNYQSLLEVVPKVSHQQKGEPMRLILRSDVKGGMITGFSDGGKSEPGLPGEDQLGRRDQGSSKYKQVSPITGLVFSDKCKQIQMEGLKSLFDASYKVGTRTERSSKSRSTQISRRQLDRLNKKKLRKAKKNRKAKKKRDHDGRAHKGKIESGSFKQPSPMPVLQPVEEEEEYSEPAYRPEPCDPFAGFSYKSIRKAALERAAVKAAVSAAVEAAQSTIQISDEKGEQIVKYCTEDVGRMKMSQVQMMFGKEKTPDDGQDKSPSGEKKRKRKTKRVQSRPAAPLVSAKILPQDQKPGSAQVSEEVIKETISVLKKSISEESGLTPKAVFATGSSITPEEHGETLVEYLARIQECDSTKQSPTESPAELSSDEEDTSCIKPKLKKLTRKRYSLVNHSSTSDDDSMCSDTSTTTTSSSLSADAKADRYFYDMRIVLEFFRLHGILRIINGEIRPERISIEIDQILEELTIPWVGPRGTVTKFWGAPSYT